MEQKVFKLYMIIPFLVFHISCGNSKETNNSIYGKWTDVEDNNLKVNIDSLTNQITIDYTALGGRYFSSTYQLNDSNKIVSTILPRGAKFTFDEKGYMRFYPIKIEYTKDIEMIYSVTLKKRSKKNNHFFGWICDF